MKVEGIREIMSFGSNMVEFNNESNCFLYIQHVCGVPKVEGKIVYIGDDTDVLRDMSNHITKHDFNKIKANSKNWRQDPTVLKHLILDERYEDTYLSRGKLGVIPVEDDIIEIPELWNEAQWCADRERYLTTKAYLIKRIDTLDTLHFDL